MTGEAYRDAAGMSLQRNSAYSAALFGGETVSRIVILQGPRRAALILEDSALVFASLPQRPGLCRFGNTHL